MNQFLYHISVFLDIYLSCFQTVVKTTMNNAIAYFCVQVLCGCVFISLEHLPRKGITGS